MNLSLPTGTLHATGEGDRRPHSVKAAFAEIEAQFKKHMALLRKDYEWKRKRPREGHWPEAGERVYRRTQRSGLCLAEAIDKTAGTLRRVIGQRLAHALNPIRRAVGNHCLKTNSNNQASRGAGVPPAFFYPRNERKTTGETPVPLRVARAKAFTAGSRRHLISRKNQDLPVR